MERWLDINGYEGLYQVSDFGRVRSLGNGQTHKSERILKPTHNRNRLPYQIVSLTKDGITKSFSVHRLVACAFIPCDYCENYQIDHIDGNPENNCLDNLRWCSAKQNSMNPITRNRKSNSKKGEFNPNHKSKLVGERAIRFDEMIRKSVMSRSKKVAQMKDGKMISVFDNSKEAEKITGVSSSNINRCCNKKRKTAGNFEWCFI